MFFFLIGILKGSDLDPGSGSDKKVRIQIPTTAGIYLMGHVCFLSKSISSQAIAAAGGAIFAIQSQHFGGGPILTAAQPP
jgi:hypothetical protein